MNMKTGLVGAFRALLLDCDGVLVDSAVTADLAWRLWADELGLSRDEVLTAARGRRVVEAVRRFVDEDSVALEAERFEKLELSLADGTRACLGATSLTREIAAYGCWAVVTSAHRSVATARLLAAGLPLPPVLIAAEDVSQGKPAPDGFKEAAAALGVDARECLAFDDLEVGVAAAEASGAKALLVRVDAAAAGSISSLADVHMEFSDGFVRVWTPSAD
ncbi:HAD-IA family hydrolase [Amycolatopsis mongoliensis]|uniref:HAD-IA family hydrolase n=1 Tax=Amycolatopsis mongoliensis TaxID=715475 RepID=A0A9Y2K032_9PSEU|nr:HAD-IA family hydrolase [Amycolatopsis sp. 4-36]WIY07090.1 HAD-IA family hydrolase [Amycolatopsis sp. 4-36]